MTPLSRSSAVLFAFAMSMPAPVIAQAATARIRRTDSIELDLPAPQSVVVLGLSWYGDVALLYPIPANTGFLAAGHHTVALSRTGPWLRGGAPQAESLQGEGPRLHCIGDDSPLYQIKAATSPSVVSQPCTEFAGTNVVGQSWPILRSVVVLTTDSLPGPVPLAAWLAKLKLPDRPDALARVLAERLTVVDSTRKWWVRGLALPHPVEGPH